MKYYSEKLDKLFNTEKELIAAENAKNENALKRAKEEYDKAQEEITEFYDKFDEKLKKRIQEMQLELCDMYDKANDTASEMGKRAKDKYEQARLEAGMTAKEIKEEDEEYKRTFEEMFDDILDILKLW